MSILILAEHNNFEVKSSTLNTISAASKVGSEIDVLVVGSNIENISKEIANYEHVTKTKTSISLPTLDAALIVFNVEDLTSELLCSANIKMLI